MQIEIASNEVVTEERNGNTFRHQVAYLHADGKKYPQEFRISLGRDVAPVPVGMYEIADTAYRVGRYGDLELNPYDLAHSLRGVKK